VDIVGKKALSLDPTNEELKTFDVGHLAGCLAPIKGKQGNLLVATQTGLQILDTSTSSISTFVSRSKMEPTKYDNRYNDGKVDSSGRLWVGTMSVDESKKNQGSVFVVKADGTFTPVFSNVSISNGMAWSMDDTTFYYIDTPTQEVVQFDHDKATATLSNRTVVFKFPVDMGEPDGMTIDTDGNLWVALWNGSNIVQINPRTSTLLRMVHIPAPKVTSACFGGPNLDILYVTTASVHTDTKKYPEAGCVFAVTGLGVKGKLFNEFVMSG